MNNGGYRAVSVEGLTSNNDEANMFVVQCSSAGSSSNQSHDIEEEAAKLTTVDEIKRLESAINHNNGHAASSEQSGGWKMGSESMYRDRGPLEEGLDTSDSSPEADMNWPQYVFYYLKERIVAAYRCCMEWARKVKGTARRGQREAGGGLERTAEQTTEAAHTLKERVVEKVDDVKQRVHDSAVGLKVKSGLALDRTEHGFEHAKEIVGEGLDTAKQKTHETVEGAKALIALQSHKDDDLNTEEKIIERVINETLHVAKVVAQEDYTYYKNKTKNIIDTALKKVEEGPEGLKELPEAVQEKIEEGPELTIEEKLIRRVMTESLHVAKHMARNKAVDVLHSGRTGVADVITNIKVVMSGDDHTPLADVHRWEEVRRYAEEQEAQRNVLTAAAEKVKDKTEEAVQEGVEATKETAQTTAQTTKHLFSRLAHKTKDTVTATAHATKSAAVRAKDRATGRHGDHSPTQPQAATIVPVLAPDTTAADSSAAATAPQVASTPSKDNDRGGALSEWCANLKKEAGAKIETVKEKTHRMTNAVAEKASAAKDKLSKGWEETKEKTSDETNTVEERAAQQTRQARISAAAHADSIRQRAELQTMRDRVHDTPQLSDKIERARDVNTEPASSDGGGASGMSAADKIRDLVEDAAEKTKSRTESAAQL